MKFEDKTRGGFAVEIFATDLNGDFPVGGILTDHEGNRFLKAWRVDGRYGHLAHPKDLIPVPDYSEFKKGDMCWVWDVSRECRSIEFFSHLADRGGVNTTDNPEHPDTMHWRYCEKVFQPLSDKKIIELWEEAGSGSVFFARLIEKEIVKQVEK